MNEREQCGGMMETPAQTTILVVDDSEIFLQAVTAYFTKRGIRVYTSRSVSEACLLVGRNPGIDIMFLDFHLNGINDGTELLKKLKKYSMNHIRIFACSASDSENRKLLEYGCDGVTGKDLAGIKQVVFGGNGR